MMGKTIKLFFLGCAIIFAYCVYGIYGYPVERGGMLRFTIPAGASVEEVSRELYKAGFINSKLLFQTYVRLLKMEGKIQAGDYDIDKGVSIAELTRVLVLGTALERERTVTFIEGWSLRDVAAYLVKQGFAKNENEVYALTGKPATFPTSGKDFSAEYDVLKDQPKNVNLEGYVYPDTYRVYKDASVEDILRRALNNFETKVTSELRAEIKKQGKDLHDVIILASIVEREVRGKEDRRMVADIFLRRLEVGMGLQADSTVNYITGGEKPSVTHDETAIDSPYNTYKYRGLPAGPISNPSIEAIEAVVYPKANDFWYFLTTLDDGRVIYARTNDEQNENRYKYLK